jgi:hypothetical protein
MGGEKDTLDRESAAVSAEVNSMETIIANLAGAIDLDGYIRIRRIPRLSDRPRYRYTPAIGLTDVSPIIPDLLQEHFAGSRSAHVSKKSGELPAHGWEASGRTARQPLLLLLPHLRIKRRQAELALELLEALRHQQSTPSVTPAATQEEAMARLFEEWRKITPSRRRRKERV